MHETSVFRDLMDKIISVANAQGASGVVSIQVRLGAYSGISPDHFREHFEIASAGTIAEGARLDIEVIEDLEDSGSLTVLLESVELEKD